MKTASKIKEVVKKKASKKISEKKINQLLTEKMAKLQTVDVKKASKAVLTQSKKVTTKEVKEVIEMGLKTMNIENTMTDVIVRDFDNRKGNDSLLTTELNELFKSGDERKVNKVKKWVKTRLQTLIKNPPIQERLLGEKVREQQITIKKVTKPMVENTEGLYLDNFNESDLGQFKAVRISKVKEELTIAEELLKWMRSKKSEGLFTGDKTQAKETDCYDLQAVIAIAESIEKNGI